MVLRPYPKRNMGMKNDNHATLLGYTSYKVVQVSLDEQWPDETKENITRQYAVGRSRKSWKIFEITEK